MAGINGRKWAKRKDRSNDELERLSLDEAWDIITDKRFTIRFKIANLICRDYLRNYLASANLRLSNCIDVLDNDCYSDEVKLKYIDRNIRRVKKTINEVFDF